MPTYEEACAQHEWRVPERYNIAADVCDKHPREKLAMVWERFDGARRDVMWGEIQDLSAQAAHALAKAGVGRGDRVAVVLPPTAETAAILDRKSTRLNSSHANISYAVFCLKKKKITSHTE